MSTPCALGQVIWEALHPIYLLKSDDSRYDDFIYLLKPDDSRYDEKTDRDLEDETSGRI